MLDIALLKNVNLRLNSIEAFHELDSDHRPVVVEFLPRNGGPSDGATIRTIVKTDWGRLRDKLTSTSSPFLDNISDDIVSAQDALGAIDSLRSTFRAS